VQATFIKHINKFGLLEAMGCGRSIFSKERGKSATLQATKKLIKAKKSWKEIVITLIHPTGK